MIENFRIVKQFSQAHDSTDFDFKKKTVDLAI